MWHGDGILAWEHDWHMTAEDSLDRWPKRRFWNRTAGIQIWTHHR